MSAGKIIAYIGAAILIIFGVLFILAAFGQVFNPGYFLVGLILLAIGFILIWFASRQKPAAQADNVTVKIDLPGNVKLDSLKCRNCGGTLSSENIKLVEGAPWVTCPYCGSVYQLTEEPKW